MSILHVYSHEKRSVLGSRVPTTPWDRVYRDSTTDGLEKLEQEHLKSLSGSFQLTYLHFHRTAMLTSTLCISRVVPSLLESELTVLMLLLLLLLD